mmetsp:Transcript_50040/g.119536  ORF Transcript_50040/g.119536 Transcript_50040/m.119536 type:complete len:319 (-) Transcript_50040:1522-2478(-)
MPESELSLCLVGAAAPPISVEVRRLQDLHLHQRLLTELVFRQIACLPSPHPPSRCFIHVYGAAVELHRQPSLPHLLQQVPHLPLMLQGVVLLASSIRQVLEVRRLDGNDVASVDARVVHHCRTSAKHVSDSLLSWLERPRGAQVQEERLALGLKLEHLDAHLEGTGQRMQVQGGKADVLGSHPGQHIVREVLATRREVRMLELGDPHGALLQIPILLRNRTAHVGAGLHVILNAARSPELIPLLFGSIQGRPLLECLLHGSAKSRRIDERDQRHATPGHLHTIHVNYELLRVEAPDGRILSIEKPLEAARQQNLGAGR